MQIWLFGASLVAQRLKRPPLMQRPGFDLWVGKFPWRRKWQPTPGFLPGESQGWRSLVGYSSRGRKESDTTEQLHSLTLPICTKRPWTFGQLTRPEWSFIPNQIKLIFSQEIFFKAKKFALKLDWSFKRKGCQLRTVFGPSFPILCAGKERDPVVREEWGRHP